MTLRPPDIGLPRRLPPAGLEASDAMGALFSLAAALLTAGGVALASADSALLWAAGQVLLALAFLQWFSLLHEAGHGILFRSPSPNRVVGWIAGFLTLIPFPSWCVVHGAHHRWTGWRDLDASSEILAPRPRRAVERGLWNVAWATWLPLFSIVYRWSNFWNVARFLRFHPESVRAAIVPGALHLLGYAALAVVVGPGQLVALVGPGLLLGLALHDLVLLSQHTHIPTPSSQGVEARPRSGREQATYTRSVALPPWLGVGLLCGIGEHELHHAFPQVPGYRLHRIPASPPRRVHALAFLRQAKRLRGTQFLFSDAEATGLDV